VVFYNLTITAVKDRKSRETFMRYKDHSLMEQIKVYVEEYALDNGGTTPSTREIGAKFGVSNVLVYRYLKSMDEIGMIRYDKGYIYTDRIDKIERQKSLSPSYSGSIPAGSPDEVEARIEEYVSIPSVFVDNSIGKHFILKVVGDSMIDAGITSGDLVIIREEISAKAGDIVAALVDGTGSTLKRLKSDDIGLFLWAENESWDNKKRFYGRNFQIQGVALKVVKNLT